MNIQSFDINKADYGHEGTLRSTPFIPTGMNAPFGAVWAYLEVGMTMAEDQHEHPEIYAFFEGNASIRVGDIWQEVHPGDAVEIPGNAVHQVKNLGDTPVRFVALWW